MMTASTMADQPEDMCTTVPPAKSMALMEAFAFQTPFIMPSMPHTMWASGKYTTTIQATRNAMRDEYFIRSAMAPTMRPGVMIANISWYIENTFCDTQGEYAPFGFESTPASSAKSMLPMNGLPVENAMLYPNAHQSTVTMPARPMHCAMTLN